MSYAEVLVSDTQLSQNTSRQHDADILPAAERKRITINGSEVDAERISGRVVGSRIKQHNHIYTTHHNNYMSSGDVQVYSTVQNEQWETSEVRLRFHNGNEKVYNLPFPVNVGDGDLLSIIKLYNTKDGKGYTTAAQNHTTQQWYSKEGADLQRMVGSLGLFKLAVVLLSNKSALTVYALMVIFIFAIFGNVILALFGGVLLTGLLVLAFQYLVILPWTVVVWPKVKRQFEAFFEDFSAWQ
ncbi:hypothetical protein J2T08_001903 [Neorhizobium galegae]|uniref:hypothetical protein n=1 Tax=Neorhizobium galegae TaxID=399 RepID=UPI0027877529|nr:hypothetical protein [Neorhizobium galegae]MDQ0133985.1 hypothetical protein [Neorhizobium galegae]